MKASTSSAASTGIQSPQKKAAVNYSASSHYCAVLPPGLGQLVGWELGGRSDDVWDTVATHGHNPKVAAGLQDKALPIAPVGVALRRKLVVQGANDPIILRVNNIHRVHVGADEGRGLAPVLEANPDTNVEMPARAGEAQADRRLEVNRAQAVVQNEKPRVGLAF